MAPVRAAGVSRFDLATRIVVGVLVAAGCFYFGADVWSSLAFGIAVMVLTVTALVRPVHHAVDWPESGSGDWAGTRQDVTDLSWSLTTRFGRVGSTAVTRLQRLARQRLAAHQLDLRAATDQAIIEQLLGAGTYRVLTSANTRRPTMRTYIRCLDRLDALSTLNSGDIAREHREH